MYFESAMSALVTVDNVWNFEGDEECFGEDLYCSFSRCRDMCDFDLYFKYLRGKKFPEFFFFLTTNGVR